MGADWGTVRLVPTDNGVTVYSKTQLVSRLGTMARTSEKTKMQQSDMKPAHLGVCKYKTASHNTHSCPTYNTTDEFFPAETIGRVG